MRMLIPELSNKGDSPWKPTKSNNLLAKQVSTLKVLVQKLLYEKQVEEGKVASLGNVVTRKYSCIDELNTLVESMQKEEEERKFELKIS